MTPQVIGISGVTGAGKTTLTNLLAHELNATALYWDHFDKISIFPPDYVDWYHRGKDYTEWDYSELADILESLKNRQTVLHPTLKKELQPTKFIIFDALLGRLHPQTGKLIDTCIHIEVPLDISLCRHLIRDFKSNDKTKDELIDELEYYLSDSRPLFFDDELKAKADLVIDGLLAANQQLNLIKTFFGKDQ